MDSQLRAIGRRLSRHRSTRLTSEGVQFLLFTLAVGVAATNTGNNLFYLLLAMMLSVVLISGVVAEHCLRRLEFHRHLPELLCANQPSIATLVVKKGPSQFPSFSIRLFDVIDGQDVDRGLTIRQIFPETSQLLSYPLLATRRGRLQLDGVRVVTSFPFGLFLKKAYFPVPGMTVVCPEIRPLSDDVVDNIVAAGHQDLAHRRGPGNDLYNLRLYHSGDDSRNIHWVTTARTSQLMVRETEGEEQRRVNIHLATQAPPTHTELFEDSITFTASLVSHLSNQGFHLRLTAGAYASSFGTGSIHLMELLKALALCERDSMSAVVSDESLWDTDAEEAPLIIVRAWDGAECPSRPSILFDPIRVARSLHVV